MCIRHLYISKVINASEDPSEYAFQSEFAAIFRNLLPKAYPDLRYRVLVEVKERNDEGKRRQRLDLLVRDGSSLPAYGFELAVAAGPESFRKHCVRSEEYSKLHNCHVYMVNLCATPTLNNYFGKGYQNVTPVNVVIKNNGGTWNAEVRYSTGDIRNVVIKNPEWDMIFDSTLRDVV